MLREQDTQDTNKTETRLSYQASSLQPFVRRIEVEDLNEGTDVLANLHQRSDEDLREILDELLAEEERISYRRRILHGQIDIIRAELVARLKTRREEGKSIITGKDVEKLSEILAKGPKRETKE